MYSYISFALGNKDILFIVGFNYVQQLAVAMSLVVHVHTMINTVWRERLVGGKFGELTHFEHLVKESLVT